MIKFKDSTDDAWIGIKPRKKTDASSIIEIRTYNPYTLDITTIFLDKSTSIHFAKQLRTEINKIQE